MKEKPIIVTMPPMPFNQLDPSNGADPIVLKFISDFYDNSCGTKETRLALHSTFMHGYCYYFAHILKTAFGTGEVCWCAPNGHFVWCADYNGKTYAYDIEGVSIAEADYYIPEHYMLHYVDDFKHVEGKSPNATDDDIEDIISSYKVAVGISKLKYPHWWHKKISMPTEQEDALFRMQKGEDAGSGFIKTDAECFKRIFGINRHYLYMGDFIAPADETNFEGSECYITDEGLSGFCVTADGWLCCVFSNAHKGDFIERIAELVKDKVKALTCITSEYVGNDLAKRYAKAFGLCPCATTINDSAKFASYYGDDFANYFISKWGSPKHVFLMRPSTNTREPVPAIDDYFDAKHYVDNLLKGVDSYAEQKKYATA